MNKEITDKLKLQNKIIEVTNHSDEYKQAYSDAMTFAIMAIMTEGFISELDGITNARIKNRKLANRKAIAGFIILILSYLSIGFYVYSK